MAGINLDLVTDTRDIQKGFKTVEEALEDVADALDDVAKEGDQSTEKLERSFSELARETKKEAREMGQEVSGSYDKMARESGEATKQMKDDAFSNAKEVASSFDGSAESIVDGFQGAAAEMFSGFGPGAAAAGIAAAAGLGLISAELIKQQEEADEAASRVDEMVSDMIDSSLRYATELDKLEAFKAIIGTAEQRAEAQAVADSIGVPLIEVAQAMVGLGDSRELVEERIRAKYQEQLDILGESGLQGEARVIREEQIKDELDDQLELVGRFENEWETAREVASLYYKAVENTNTALEDQKELYQENEREILNLGSLDATPQFDTSPWIEKVKRFREEAQNELNRLSAPSISIGRRIP